MRRDLSRHFGFCQNMLDMTASQQISEVIWTPNSTFLVRLTVINEAMNNRLGMNYLPKLHFL